MKKLKYTSAVTRSVFGFFLWRGKILVCDDKTGRWAIPGGKMVPADKRRPKVTLRKEVKQEIGSLFDYRHILPAPLIFGTGIDVHTYVEEPQCQRIDLRLVYLLEALNDKILENQPEEMINPRFVDLAEFEKKELGVETRTTVGIALEMFFKAGHLPEPTLSRQEPEDDNELINGTLLGMGFSKKFARDHSYGR